MRQRTAEITTSDREADGSCARIRARSPRRTVIDGPIARRIERDLRREPDEDHRRYRSDSADADGLAPPIGVRATVDDDLRQDDQAPAPRWRTAVRRAPRIALRFVPCLSKSTDPRIKSLPVVERVMRAPPDPRNACSRGARSPSRARVNDVPADIEWRVSDAPVPYEEALAFMEQRAAAIRDGTRARMRLAARAPAACSPPAPAPTPPS